MLPLYYFLPACGCFVKVGTRFKDNVSFEDSLLVLELLLICYLGRLDQDDRVFDKRSRWWTVNSRGAPSTLIQPQDYCPL